ncbi:MAG: pseudouridine synthase [Hyphomicrobiaceae bacterium]
MRSPAKRRGHTRPSPPSKRRRTLHAETKTEKSAVYASKIAATAKPDDRAKMRIAKAIARAGLCSRREAERWIADGRVQVNGETISSPALDIAGDDHVTVDRHPLPTTQGPPRIWRYYKPRGLVTTHSDPRGRATVFESLPTAMPRTISVGRLDFNTEGLLLLTTDGDLARHFELPINGWLRRYRVRAHGRISQNELDSLKTGICLEGIQYGPIDAQVESVQGGNSWISIGLREGKNREVRRIFNSFGLQVNRLIRTSFGPFQLLNLEVGAIEEVPASTLAMHLGKKVAAKFGLHRARNSAHRSDPVGRSAIPSSQPRK